MRRVSLAGLVALLVASCSGVKFGYNQLDWLVPRYVERYVALDDAQSDLLKRHLAELRQWHCGTQLAGYAEGLREVNADLQNGPVAYARVAARFDLIGRHWDAIKERAAPAIAALLATATDEQLDELFSSLEEANGKFKSEYVDRSESKRRAAAANAMRKRVEDWIGDLTPVQQRAVGAWSEHLELTGNERLQFRRRWQAELRRVLDHRDDLDRFDAAAQAFVQDPQRYWSAEYKLKNERNRERTLMLLVAIAATLEPDQHRHLAKRADRWAADFEQLACNPSQLRAAATRSP